MGRNGTEEKDKITSARLYCHIRGTKHNWFCIRQALLNMLWRLSTSSQSSFGSPFSSSDVAPCELFKIGSFQFRLVWVQKRWSCIAYGFFLRPDLLWRSFQIWPTSNHLFSTWERAGWVGDRKRIILRCDLASYWPIQRRPEDEPMLIMAIMALAFRKNMHVRWL